MKSDEQEELSVEEAYSFWSETYDLDRNLTRDLDQVVTATVLEGLVSQSIIEVGCGTGKNTPFLARIGKKVMALDFSERMIHRARVKVSGLGLNNVTFRVVDVTKDWPCEDRSADLVVCNLVLEHIEELDLVFSEAARCLVPKGSLFVCELHPYRQYQGTKASFQRDQQRTQIRAFVHDISEFLNAAKGNGLKMETFAEWRHEQDENKLPRLASFMFEKVVSGIRG